MKRTLVGTALTALVCLGAACNPYQVLEPNRAAPDDYVPTDDFCVANPNTGRCPQSTPTDLKPG